MVDRQDFNSAGPACFAARKFPDQSSNRGGRPGVDAFLTVCDRLNANWLERSPEGMTELGLDTGGNNRARHELDDRSAEAYGDFLRSTRDLCRQAAAIDRRELTGAFTAYRSVVVDHVLAAADGALHFGFGTTGEAAPFMLNQLSMVQPYVVGTLNGAYQGVPDFLINKHPLADAADAEAYLDRVRSLPGVLNAETRRLRIDAMEKGVVPPNCLLDPAIARLDELIRQPAGETALVRHLRGGCERLRLPEGITEATTRILDSEVKPALARQMEELRRLNPGDSQSPGVARLRDGGDYYAWCLRISASASRSAEEIHAIGLDQVADIAAQADAALRKQGYAQGTVGERLSRLADEPRFSFPDDHDGKEAILATFRSVTMEAARKLPLVFGRLPPTALSIEPVPPELEADAPRGYYQRADLFGARQATYFANLRTTKDWSKFYLPTFAFHEGMPGHHLQFALAMNAPDLPEICRFVQMAGFSEGWALYAEQLADELGLYDDDPWGRIGYLQSSLLRAARLVVDTGLHHYGWLVEKCVDYLVTTVGETPGRSRSEVLRYVSWPGNACSYKLGHLAWTEMRKDVQGVLAAGFDPKGFHDEALRYGAMPLDQMRSSMQDWARDRAAAMI
ncbi:DUF885 domain-containing protein [Nitratireductor pacificus]|uniref:DUF885 domain-containing protein n=1 Tax=Nitratireductor pacificus pht-3B TaxID=391937 RepID=K2MZV2_9HYPH|nr:DUF885 domain-containing protein [Nitratireductor pacificus]EKF17508.1 hypothetical protein NA2_17796 [Nitratireductor pacificus pht-3B]